MRSHRIGVLAVLAALLVAGCSSRSSKDLAGEAGALPYSLPGAAIPLDVREFDVVYGEGGFRGVFLKLSRLPSGVTHTTATDPPRIILDIAGPTGSESPPEAFAAGDDLVTQIQLARRIGAVQVVLELAGESVPEYEVLPMADWVLVRLKPSGPRRPWAHRRS